MNRVYENNQATISGMIFREARYSHEVFGEGFYVVEVNVPRLSGVSDCIPVTISKRMCNVKELHVGQPIAVYGQFRSFNRRDGDRSHLELFVFAQEMELLNEHQVDYIENNIFLDGYICKKPLYRETPRGHEIADVSLAVNRPYGKSDYIPCITWGRNALFASGLEVGSRVQVYGRIQSREYVKKLSETETETRTVYEVSVNKIELIEEESVND